MKTTMTLRLLTFILLVTQLLATNLFGQNQVAYLRSTTGTPWGNSTNEEMMDVVFGSDNWDDLRYETVDIVTLLTNRSFIFLEGSDDLANELEAFLNNNISAIESWVSSGGNIFINSAPNEGDGMNLGFGGVVLNDGPNLSSINAFDTTHPIFNGPYLPVGIAWTGNSISHGTIQGPDLINLAGSGANIVLAMKQWGAGKAIFGGMTTVNYHGPAPEATHLRQNVLDYLRRNPVRIDAGIIGLEAPIAFCAGNQDIIVTLANLGLDTLTNITIDWEFDGILQSQTAFNGVLDTIGSGDNSVSFTLGNENFATGVIHTLKAWTSLPNGIQDTINVNDTLFVDLSAGLNGTYTIGGDSPDYTTISGAVDALNAFGVCGPSTFNIRTGFYDEQFSINEFIGSDCEIPVIFQSESGDSTDVVINDVNEDFSSNYIVELNGADGITFSKMTFVSTGSYARIVNMREGADCNTFQNCVFEGSAVASSSTNYALITTESNATYYKNNIKNNVFRNGSYALYLLGDDIFIGPEGLIGDGFEANFAVDPDSANLQIADNLFEGQYARNIYLESFGSTRVVNNTLNSNSTYSSWRSVLIENSNGGVEVSGNTITALRGTGIELTYSEGTITQRNLIANNFIAMSGDNTTTRGIYTFATINTDIYHNNINITTTNTTESTGLYMSSFDNANIINNCIANTGDGYAIRYEFPTNSVSNYNNFYHAGNYIGNYNGTPTDNLTDWQNANGFDASSITVDPLYTSDTDLHVNTIDLNAVGTPLTDVPNDIDGDTRDAATPDIGADEFTPPPNDAGVLDILAPDIPFPAGTYAVYGVLKNYGTDDLLSANLYWEINDSLQSVVNWSGTLTSGDTLSVLLGNVDIGVDAAYALVAWSDMPNGVADMFPANDTTDVVEIYAGLGGEYTLGGVDPDFADFAAAEDALNRGGVYAPVTINVRDGLYNEQIHLMEIIGADSTNNVVFQSESGDSTAAVIEFPGTNTDNYIWYLDGTDYITLRGLTFKVLGTSYSNGIVFENGANNNIIENNYFDGNGTYGYMVYSNSTQDEENVIRNNYFEEGRTGIYFIGNSSFKETANVISGNVLKEQSREAIYLQNQSGLIVENNEIESFINSSTYTGMFIYECDDALQITGNSIVSCCRYYGIQVQYCNSTLGNEGLIANNFISLLRTNGDVYGINPTYNNYQKYYHNTINIQSTNTNSRAFYNVGGSDIDIRNNIFTNEGAGYAIYTTNTSSITISDNNNFYSTGENLAYWSLSIATLADWQTTTGLDAASVSVDPFFESDSTYVVAQVSLNGKAQPLAEVTTDIEGNTRDAATPDIGAYEFTPPAVDAGVIAVGLPDAPFAVGDHLVQAVLKNFGTDTLTSVTLDWEVNDVAQASVSWNGILASDDTLEVGLDIVNFELAEPYTFKIWSSQPNAQTDLISVNDTTTISDVYAGLGGSYTLGGITPDFDDFTQAATVLNLGGVYAPVDIQIRDGSYNEQIQLFEIPGADSTNQVILESENDDPTLVTLSHSSGSGNNYVLRLTDTDWLTVEGITLQATNTSYSRVIWLEDNAMHNTFLSNIITSPSTTSTSTTRAVIYSTDNGANEYNGFVNNTISNGSYGIYLDGSYNDAAYTSGNHIIGNTFENQNYMGIRLQDYQREMIISDNFISSNTTYSSYYGIYLDDLYDGIDVLRNQVIGITRYGIYAYSISASENAPLNIVNNFVELSGTSSGWGIAAEYGNYQNVYHNTVSVSNTNTESKAFYSYAGSNKYVKNNIFANTGGGYAYYSGTGYGITESDYNDLYVTGTNTAFWNGAQATLEDWQATTSFDTTSVAIDPIFVSPTDLHVSNVLLDKKGTPLPSVTDDIDGDTRDPILPDIGADEFSTAENDASLFSIDSPNIPFPAENQEVYITLLNNGLDTLQSADIDWEVNDQPQAPFSWIGTLLPGGQADSILLGNFTFERDTMYNITAWSSNPNGFVDTETYNDTIQLTDLYAALSGIYTIGGASPDYQDFTEAATALDRGGVVGEVIFEVRSGTYNEQISIDEIIGASADNTITFRSETGDSTQVILTYDTPTSADNYVVRLDGADWLRFEQMTLQSAGNTSYEHVIEMLNGADNNVFSNNVIIGRDVSSSSSNYAPVYAVSSTPNNNNSFLNNYIQEGNYGLYLESGSTNNPQIGTVISGNTFENQYYDAVYQRYGSGSMITYNQITTNNTNSSYEGIYLYNGLGGNTITHNVITELPRGDGIYLRSMNATAAEPDLIANNFIQTGIGNYDLNGILASSSFYTNIYHNNVHITSTSTSAKAVYISSGGSVNIQNNILVNTGGGYAIYNNTSGNITTSDYNDLYATGTNIGAWSSSAVTNLAAWQAASGQDVNSISIDPLFVSPTDLHVQEIDLNDSGTPLAVVTDDIDGEARSATAPDIGADEFTPATNNDASIEEIVSPSADVPFPAQDQDVFVALKNNGIDTIYNVNISWSVNDNIQNAVNWEGELLPGQRDTVLVGDYTFLLGIPHEIIAYTSIPNGLPDAIPANDTTIVDDLYAGLSGVYSLGGNLADFEDFAQATNALNKGGVLGPVEFLINDGTYNEQINLTTINGVDATNTVIFRSASGDNSLVTIRYGSPYLMKLSGTDYVTFENLTFEYTYYYSYNIVQLENGANNNQFLNNIFTSTNSSTSTYIYSNSSSLDNNTRIEGNTFEGAGYGIKMYGTGSSTLESGTIIRDNILTNQNYEGINVYYQDAPEIIDNLVTAESGSSSYVGIYARDTDNGLRIENNQIYTHSGTGIYLYRCDGTPADHARVVNNFTRVAGTATSYGIYTYYGNYIDVYHNNIALTNTAAASRVMYSYYGSNKNTVNNVFANFGGGYAIHSTSSGYAALDYNDLYTTGAILGNWNGTDATTLPNWRQLSGRDIHSVYVDPLFVSDNDLHITQTDLDGTGIFLPQVTLDIDGETRDTNTPDIGADEISTLPKDVGILAIINPITDCGLPQNDSLVIQIRNYGTQAQSGFDLAFQIGANTPVTETISQTIGVGNTFDYVFATPISLPADSIYQITTYTLLTDDGQLQNDTLTIEVIGYPAQVPMIVTPSQTICQGENIILEASGEGSFQWNGSYNNSQFNVSPSQTTTYTVVNTNQYGCTQSAEIEITVIPPPATATVSVGNGDDNLICSGDSIELVSSISDNLVWSTGDTTQSITASAQGYYYVDHYDPETGCYARSNYLYVNVYNEPYLYVNGFTSVCEGDATTLIVYNGNSYQWSTGETTQSISVTPTEATVYSVTMMNAAGCSQVDSVEMTLVPSEPPGMVSNMLPADGAVNLSVPINFSWLPATGASDYDIYIWAVGTNRPSYPTRANFNGINFSYSNLTYGTTYNWQVISENSCFTTDGPVQTFMVKDPSNLIVENVEMLASPFSGQTAGVSWEVNNIGIGATGTNSDWKDGIYLSVDSTLGNSDILMRSVMNTSALLPGESYLNYATIDLPEGAVGPYYILIRANRTQSEVESDYDDNVTSIFIDVALSPPPDLQVTNILPPGITGFAFSGETIPITYTVTNEGTGLTPSPNWQDRIFWSEESVYNPTNLNYAGARNHSGSLLQPGESYTTTANIDLPDNYAGTVYIYIVTDYFDVVFEYLDEDNNVTRSQPLDILLTPPPDLEVSSSTITETLTTQQSTSIEYITTNDGGSTTVSGYWLDSLFLSPTMMLDSNAVYINRRSHNNIMVIDELEYSNLNTTIPNISAGTYYLIIKTDVTDNIYEGDNEGNNTYVHPNPLTILNPDLEVITATTPTTTVETGASVEVNWQVKNTDAGTVFSTQRKDKVYISANAVLDTTEAVVVAEVAWNTPVSPDDTISLSVVADLPVSFIEGTHYLHILTDAEDAIYEAEEANNSNSITIQINVAPWGDLVVDNIGTLPDSIFAGDPFPFAFTVKNNGIADADDDIWNDKIYISINDTWHPDSVTFLTEYTRYQPLEKDSTYTIDTEITFPMLSLLVAGLDSFSYVYAYIYTDGDNDIFEYNSENNNILRSNPIHVTCPPPVDLDILAAFTTMPDTIKEGDLYTLQWNVQNLGSTTANWDYELWYDGLYLSTDMVYDYDEDIFVYDWTESGPLGADEIYEDYREFTVPNGNYGDYYLLLVSDHTELNNDGNFSNNVYVIQNIGGNSQVYIESTPKPDLEITAFGAPPSGIAGQPVTLTWTVQNNGTAPVEVPFTEQFKLTNNADGTGGFPLGQHTYEDSLAVGESYTYSLDFDLPINASGNYFLVMRTEATNQIFETDAGEENNMESVFITVTPQTPSDLIVADVTVTPGTSVFVDENLSFEYTVKNIGTNPAVGVRKDIIYLSSDPVFNANDPILATVSNSDTILPFQEITKMVDATVPGITPGDYFVIVNTDGFNNILETDEENNTAASANQVTVTLPELVIGTPENTVLTDNLDKYYKIEVPDSLAGETLVITLDSDGAVGNNELYLKYGETPTLSNADYFFEIPFSTYQELIVESLEAGTYYLLVTGEVQPGSEQNITLLADILPFEIRSIDAEEGGNTGNVTIRIDGAKFEPNMEARLEGSMNVTAIQTYFINSTRIFATFNLAGADLGMYNVIVDKGMEDATLVDGFEVVTGSFGNSEDAGSNSDGFSCSITLNDGVENLLDQELDYPSAVRRNRTVEINIYFQNEGNIDIPIPTRFLLSVSGHPVSATVAGLDDEAQELFIEFTENGGPPGILRAGANGLVRAYTKSFSSGTVIELLLIE